MTPKVVPRDGIGSAGVRFLIDNHEGDMRKLGLIVGASVLAIVLIFGWWVFSRPERGTTGSVSTRFHLLGPNDKIVVDGFDDPKVEGVACHLSRAQTGGLKGGFGVAEDTSDAGIACRQVGPIKITGELKDGERVFDERRSLIFKTLQVVRFFDRQRNVLVYVAYSDRVIEGSPKNSISSVPIMNWPGTQTSASPHER
jgi:CreA protein